MFFAKMLGRKSFSMSASAVATANPRDIVFVVDLSGSMNDDTEPAWASGEVDKMFGPLGYAGIGKSLMQDVYKDFGYGAYPGVSVYVGQPLGVSKDKFAYAEMTKDKGPLSKTSIPAQYRIKSTDNEATRKKKAYSWIIDNQIAVIMPNAKPMPNSSTNYAYWEKYLDYIVLPVTITAPTKPTTGTGSSGGGSSGTGSSGSGSSGSGSNGKGGTTTPPVVVPKLPPVPKPPIGYQPINPGRGWAVARQADRARAFLLKTDRNAHTMFLPSASADRLIQSQQFQLAFFHDDDADDDHTVYPPGTPPLTRGALPASQNADRITGFNNPNTSTFPGASASVPASYRNWIGYLTYTQFMMDYGRDLQPVAGQYVPLSVLSPDCPLHAEGTAGGTFSFPLREQPMHAARRSLIAGLQVMKDRNMSIANLNQRDWAGVITFDAIKKGTGAKLQFALSGDYDAAMQACTKIQPVGDKGSSTATDSGLEMALKHLKPVKDGGGAREDTNKDVILLTDGVPNAHSSPAGDVLQFIQDAADSSEFYNTGATWMDAALMKTAQLRANKIRVFPVGVGGGCDYNFMDRVARLGGTADAAGRSPRGSGNPADYELRLQKTFEAIITNPQVRLVQQREH